MTLIENLGRGSTRYLISSIINLVCPHCGGRMSEFQCEGRCRRSWHAAWQRANKFYSAI